MLDTMLNRYIKARGYRVNDIAQMLGISRQALHKKMTGKTEWTAREALQLKSLLGISDKDMPAIFEK